MKVVYNKKFLKDLSKLPSQDRSKVESFVFEKMMGFNTPKEIIGLEKLEGYKNYYRIRFGNYRAGVQLEAD